MKRIDEDEWKVSNSGKFKSSSVYQCIVIILFDNQKKIGAIYHTPESGLLRTDKVVKDRVENAEYKLKKIFKKLEEIGVDYENLKAVISGGIEKGIDATISKTLEKIKKLLMEKGVELLYEDTGGSNIRRDITLKIPEGKVKITKRAESKSLKKEIMISIPDEKIKKK